MASWDWHLWLEVGHYVLIPLAYWLGRQLLTTFEKILTENVMSRVDKRFTEHEKCDDRIRERLDRIEELLIMRQSQQKQHRQQEQRRQRK